MTVELDFWVVLKEWPLLLTGVVWTLGLTFVSACVGIFSGLGLAWVRTQNWPMVSRMINIYVELIRNTPFIVQLFFIFFGLPQLGFRFSAETSSVLAMVINLSAYSTEIIRSGVEATPSGQIQAGKSLGFTEFQVFKHVILPPALFRVWPALVAQIIIVMLGSAVCGQISTEELSYSANLIQSRNFRAFEAFIVAAANYLCLAIVIRWCLNRLGKNLIFKGLSQNG
jgi:polar amino acid transport system permease protein